MDYLFVLDILKFIGNELAYLRTTSIFQNYASRNLFINYPKV